jgi:hypothetical protein
MHQVANVRHTVRVFEVPAAITMARKGCMSFRGVYEIIKVCKIGKLY